MKIIFATGGSGGHIFPALKTAEYLKNNGHEIFFAGALTSVKERLEQAGYQMRILDVQGFHLKTLPDFIKLMLRAISASKKLLKDFKPDVVVGFGSYSSFPVLFAAKRLGIAVMIHEQNVIPGKANRLAAMFAGTIAVSFQETRAAFPGRQVVWTGCPCNSQNPAMSKDFLLDSFGLPKNYKTILVLGGSQGSRVINEVFFEMIAGLKNVQVIHMTGKSEAALYIQKYSSLGIPHHVCAFLNNIEQAYAVSDMAVARAGAATICELAAFGLPSVLVPYPFAQSHQLANARILQKAGAAVIIEQNNLNCQTLKEAVSRLLDQEIPAETIRKNLKHLFIANPAETLAQTIVKFAG